MIEFTEEQQQWIDSHYLLLPVDADGVPIKTLDELTCGSVAAVCNDEQGCYVFVHRGFDNGCYLMEGLEPRGCRHVKPDPLAELLDTLSRRAFVDEDDRARAVSETAERIRELMGVDDD